MKFLNWLLYEVHRWLGIGVALFMFTWFFTGVVIMYATPTTQNRGQQLAHSEALLPEAGWLSLGEAWERSTEQRKAAAAARKAKAAEGEMARADGAGKPKAADVPVGIVDARLVRSGGDALWLVEDSRGQRFALSAIDGSLHETTAEQALSIAANWFKAEQAGDAVKLSYLESVENPVILRNQDALKPFHHISNEEGDELLISSRTGEVLHASSRVDRGFYYAGNWLHLFKPLDSLGWGSIRHDVQVWSGFIATIATLTGLIIGWIRWRPGFNGKPTYSEGRKQPYREFWFKWHFWTGLIGGTVALFWALSGYIDTNPWKLFSTGDYTKEELSRYLGNDGADVIRNWHPQPLVTDVSAQNIVELSWRRLGGEAVLLAVTKDGQRLVQAVDGAATQFSDATIAAAIQRVATETPVASQEVISEYDSYYYPRHHQGLVEKPLPVVLAQLADDAGTRIYLDPQDGRLLSKQDRSRRVFRWLYSALHHWDFGWLYYRPIWDIWMLVWISFGLVLGASSLVIGWRRLKKTFRPKKKRTVSSGVVTKPEFATETAEG